MLAGMAPAAAFAAELDVPQPAAQSEAAISEEAPAASQDELDTYDLQNGTESEDAAETPDSTEDTEKTEATDNADSFEAAGDAEESDSTPAPIAAQQLTNGTSVQAAPTVKSVSLKEENGQVYGKGILTGSGEEFDTVTWDSVTDTNRGCDAGNDNAIVRTYDSVLYNVQTSVVGLQQDDQEHSLTYIFALPDNDGLTMEAFDGVTPERKVVDGKKIYTYTFPMNTNDGTTGYINREIPVHVGSEKNGYTFTPEITVYVDSNADQVQKVTNVLPVVVTSTPAYNITLAKSTLQASLAMNDFTSTEAADCHDNASKAGYTSNRIPGYRVFYGFSVELARPGHDIKGIELPDPSKPITFDIDLSEYNVTVGGSTQKVSNTFKPLLFQIQKNTGGGAAVGDIPYSDDTVGETEKSCANSGDVTITQEGTTLHVSLSGYTIDPAHFPKTSSNGRQQYWTDATKILRGVFAAHRILVVYPTVSTDGEKLDEIYPSGKVTVDAVADNMSITSISGKTATKADENHPLNINDNKAGDTWNLNAPGTRNHGILYSDRSANWNNGYSADAGANDRDVAAAGAKDLAFTVEYTQSHVGELYADETPKTVDQLVLFDRTALCNVKLSEYSLAQAEGYNIQVKYVRLKNGSGLKNDSELTEGCQYKNMRQVTRDEFEYADSPDAFGGVYDGIRLIYTGKAADNDDKLTLMTKFNAEVRPGVETGKVYMITLITDVTTQNDTKLDTIDNRAAYGIPTYSNNQYQNDSHYYHVTSADALYIVPYLAKITKTVAQTDTSGKTYQNFYFASGERYVDYRIAPALEYQKEVNVPDDFTTTVTLEDTLPKGMEYIAHSACFGGTYTDRGPKQPGLVTGGTQQEPVVTVNDDSTTKLVWTLENVNVKDPLPMLYYSCRLGDELDLSKDDAITSGQPLTNYIGIHTTEDQRPYNTLSENYTSATVTPYKANQFFISKTGEPWKELNDRASYTLTLSNTSTTDKPNLIAVDAMPYDGKDGTAKKGSYKLTQMTLNLTALRNATDFAVWYTEDPAKAGLMSSQLNSAELVEGSAVWKKLDYKTITVNGAAYAEFILPKGGIWPTAIVYQDANLAAGTVAQLHLEFEVVGAVGDKLHNVLTSPDNKPNLDLKDSADTKLVSRTLEGTVWYDKNQDGKIDENETRLPGVKATLLRKDSNGEWKEATLFTDPKTNQPYPSTVETDQDGNYKFVGLPEGEYRVRFTSGDGTNLGEYDAETKYDTSDNGSKVENNAESVAKDGNKLASGTINNIAPAPTLDAITSGSYTGAWQTENGIDYNMPHQNFGVIKKSDTPKKPEQPTPTPGESPKPSPNPGTTPTPSNPGTPTPAAPATMPSPAAPVQTSAPAALQAIPQTSDPMPVALLLTLAVLSLGGFAVTIAAKRRQK